MIIDVIMPKMGESLQEGTITKWLKQVGDKVERDEMILEISTDKVDTEVPSPSSGVIVDIFAMENETVEVGKVIAKIETEEHIAKEVQSSIQTVEVKQASEKQNAEKSEIGNSNILDVVMPKMGESLQEGTITKWLKQVGDKVERDEMILEISTDKVDTEVPSPASGIIVEILYEANQTIEVGKTIARISTSGTTPVNESQITQPKVITETAAETSSLIDQKGESLNNLYDKKFLSPLVKSIIQTEKISKDELDSIKGSGVDGRITKKDITNFLETRKSLKPQSKEQPKEEQTFDIKPQMTQKQTTPIIELKTTSVDDFEVIPMDRVRQLIAEHMVYSKQTSPHVTSVGEADVTNIVKFRNIYQDTFQQKEGYKLTFTPFFAKAATEAIKAFPMVNVSVDGKSIIRYKRVNLGFATALNDGNLIVPVIKNADVLNLSGFARAINDLSYRARNKKLNPDEIQGATFSITNVGTFGTLFGTPIINQPNTAIMGIGAIQKRPVVKKFNEDFVVTIRDMVYVSITYDHRVIDGMLAGQWLAKMIKSLEEMNDYELRNQF